MMNSFFIGNVEIEKTAALAPMASVADKSYRLMCKEYGASYLVSEMISSKGLCFGDKKTARLCEIESEERPYALQLFGEDPYYMGKAAYKLNEYSPDIIDINMGCPVPKVANSGDGSGLMRDPDKAVRVAEAVIRGAHRPVTVKFRKGWDKDHVNAVEFARICEQAGAAALELNIFLQPTDRHRSAQELEQEYADVVRRVAEAVKIPVSVKLPMRLTNVLAVADSLLARGARGVVMFNRFFEPDIDVERMTFVNGDPFSEPAELRNVLRSVALCTTAVPQLDVSVSTGVHDGEAAVKALLCGANAVQICSAIHEQGYGVIVDINRFIDLWAERHGFGSLAEFRGKMNYGNAESDVYQRVQYMKYFPHDAE